MTPERWRQIGELFDAAVRIDPAGREAWLRAACGGDDDLRAEVGRLLAQDERADRDGILTPPGPTSPPPDRTASWHPRAGARARANAEPIASVGDTSADDTGGFTPRAAIAPQTPRHPISEPRSVVRARLRELPMIYILMLGIAIFWRRAVLGSEDLTLYQVDVAIILALVGIIALLWSRWPIPLAWLKALELGMIGMLASRIAFVQYRLMLIYSLRDDKMMAQLTMKNVVLLISILILTYGLYVPKSWRRAALVVGPLALLPFATLMVLILQHPDRDGVALAGMAVEHDPTHPPFRLRRDDPAHAGASARPSGPARCPGCAGRSPRPGSSASIASGGGSAPGGWARSTWPSTSS